MNYGYIPVIIGGFFILIGAFFLVMEVIGIYRFKYSLTRMHASALGDTGGLFFTVLGLMVINGWQASSLKLAAIVVILWITSPVSGHLLSKLIYSTDDEVYKQCDVKTDSETGKDG